ncbi:MAG: hypothetical protein EOP56_02570 [Sphingobacteriales bacterium]|nr:MAG: hypothetical protein EOP56_02570 [Sphingobacteriales bacterium]
MEKRTLSRKELYDLVWEKPFTTLSLLYAISDNGLRKTCIRMNIPYPKAGHWQKLKSGRKTAKLPLRTDMSVSQEVILYVRNTGNANHLEDNSTPLQRLQAEIEDAIADVLTVPKKLEEPDEYVSALKNCLERQEPRFSRYIGMVSSSDATLDTKVHVTTIERALLFWDTFIKALRARGHDVCIRYSSTYVLVSGSEFKILLREKTTKESYRESNLDWTRYKPTGILALQYDTYPHKEWKDGKTQSLEQQLSRIIAYLEIEADHRMAERIIRLREEDARKEQERIIAELEKRKRDELVDFRELLHKADRWHKAQNLRSYIVEVEKRSNSYDLENNSLNKWLQWAREKADWYDPFIERHDELLVGINRDSLDDLDETPKHKSVYPYYVLESGNSYFASQWKNNYRKKE